jgi:glutamate racemase
MAKSIYFFDSGVGGLTVLHHAMRMMPYEHYTYYADVEHAPYGQKSPQKVKSIVLSAFARFNPDKIKACVVACNTATSIVIKDLRALYDYPIIGMEPAIKPAKEIADGKKIIILATTLTLKEEKLKRLIRDLDIEDQVIFMPAPDLVLSAEEFVFDSDQLRELMMEKMAGIDLSDIGALVLGCTHFIYFKPMLTSLLPDHIKLVDGNAGTVRRLSNLITPTEKSSYDPLDCILSGHRIDCEFVMPYLNYCNKHELNH